MNRNDEYAVAYYTDKQKVEKEAVYDILFSINASQNNTWEKIKQ